MLVLGVVYSFSLYNISTRSLLLSPSLVSKFNYVSQTSIPQCLVKAGFFRIVLLMIHKNSFKKKGSLHRTCCLYITGNMLQQSQTGHFFIETLTIYWLRKFKRNAICIRWIKWNNYVFSAEPSHIGLFPLQFSKTSKVSEPVFARVTQEYEERPRQRRSERRAVEEYGGREGAREGGAPCECRNCQLERKYERKRRKKSEKVTWS